MVLVFGLDFPLFELLIFFMVLLTAGIIFVLVELRRLNEYLLLERADLKRLERDLDVLELEERKIGAEEKALGIRAKKSAPKKKSSRKRR